MSTIAQKQLVSSQGYADAEIFFLGGAPGSADLQSGAALSGYNENTINGFLYPHKLNIKQCYRSLVVKERLEYNGTNPRKQREALSKVDYKYYLEQLYEEINQVRPNIIVPLDDLSLGAVFPHITTIHKPKGRKYWIDCYRGSLLHLRADFVTKIGKAIKVIPTLSPFHLETNYVARVYVTKDYERIAHYKSSVEPIEEYGLCWVARTALEFETFLKRQFAKNPKRITFDIETYGGIPSCISFCFDSFESVTVPLQGPLVSPAELTLLWILIGKVFAHDIEKNNQNIKFDWTILERFNFAINNVRSDTMLKTALLYPELPKGLDFLTSIYTPIPYYKDEGKEFNPKLHTKDRLYLYCAKDSLSASIISEKQDSELLESGMQSLYENEVAPSILVYKNMDATGILIDDAQKTKLYNKYSGLYDYNLSMLRTLVGNDNFNPRSHLKVGEFIYEELKYPIRRHTLPSGVQAYDTGKETLDDLIINHGLHNLKGILGIEILNRIIVCRKLDKVLEYIDTPLHPDGTFRASSNLGGTNTGRSSSSKTIDEMLLNHEHNKKFTRRLGRSLQTITKHGFEVDEDLFDDTESSKIARDLRSMFVPRRGFCFIEGDGKGAEARVVFVLAEDYDGLADMDRKPSIHAKTIAMILDIDPNTITKEEPVVPKINVPYYELGKRIRHAGHNGMEAFRLSMYIHAELSYCQMLMAKFHERNPKIKATYHGPVIEFVKKHRYLTCPNMRRRDFFSRLNSKHATNEILCYIQQATVSDTTKFTMHRVASDLPGYMKDYRFLTEQHDGILAEVKLDKKETYIESFRKNYERPINFKDCSLSRDFELTIPAELTYSETNWLEMLDV